MSATETPEILTLTIEARGEIISSNFPAFAEMVRARLSEINRDLTSDEDFDQADTDAKSIATAEAALKSAKEKALADAEQLHALFSQIDDLANDLSKARLDLSKQITKRKAEMKAELLAEASAKFVCAVRHRKSYDAVLANAVAGKRSFDSMEKALSSTVKSYNSLIEKSRSIIDSFVTAHGPELVMDREDLEVQSPESVEAELRRRFEAKKAAAEQQRLKLEAEKAKAEVAALKFEAAEAGKPPLPPSNLVSMTSPLAGPKIGSIATGSKAPTITADAEWEAFCAKVMAAFSPLRDARAVLTHDANKAKAAAFSVAVGTAWQVANQKEVAK